MCPAFSLPAFSHQLLHALTTTGAVMGVAALAFGLERFRHLLERRGATRELLAALRWVAAALLWSDLAVVVTMAGTTALQSVVAAARCQLGA